MGEKFKKWITNLKFFYKTIYHPPSHVFSINSGVASPMAEEINPIPAPSSLNIVLIKPRICSISCMNILKAHSIFRLDGFPFILWDRSRKRSMART